MALSLLWARVLEALWDPRTSARRILDARPSWSEALAMVLLAAAIQIAANMIIAAAAPPPPAGDVAASSSENGAGGASGSAERSPESRSADGASGAIFKATASTAMALVEFIAVSLLAWFIGAQFGGRASFEEVRGVVGWHALATAPLLIAFWALVAGLGPDQSGFSMLLLFLAYIYILYLFAAFIAEAHGFQQVGVVMAACFVVGLGAAFIAVIALMALGVLEAPAQ